jgi:prevent-host-death family protein
VSEVASHELRHNTRALLQRVQRGEELVITVDGRPAAMLGPVGSRRQWIPRAEFLRRVLGHQSDPKLGEDLNELAPDTIDGLMRAGGLPATSCRSSGSERPARTEAQVDGVLSSEAS